MECVRPKSFCKERREFLILDYTYQQVKFTIPFMENY